jgi:hypothetical protein
MFGGCKIKPSFWLLILSKYNKWFFSHCASELLSTIAELLSKTLHI